MSRPREPIKHGTIGGHRAHYRHKVPMCEPCREAVRQARGWKPFHPAPCGTPSGYDRHLRAGEDCEVCRKANTAVHRAAKAKRGPLPDGDPRHGTYNGYNNWNCRCAPCTAANTEKTRGRNLRRRAAQLGDVA